MGTDVSSAETKKSKSQALHFRVTHVVGSVNYQLLRTFWTQCVNMDDVRLDDDRWQRGCSSLLRLSQKINPFWWR